MLSLSHIQKSFNQGKETLTILKDINLTIQPGEITALVGPSGAGKTTLLQIAGLLDTPTSGSITIDGKTCDKLSDSERTKTRKTTLGFIYQFHHLLPEFTALENTMMPLLLANQSTSEAQNAAQTILKRLGLKDRLTHKPSELSGGEQQRVAIARALVHRPKLLLADEPTGNLDPSTSNEVFDLLIETAKSQNLAALIVTHNQELAKKMDHILELKNGTIA